MEVTIIEKDGSAHFYIPCADFREDRWIEALMHSCSASSPHILQKPREPVMGIEPMTPVLPRLCSTSEPHGHILQVQHNVSGSATRYSGYKLVQVGSGGFEPPKLAQLIYSQSHLTALETALVEKLPSVLSHRPTPHIIARTG